jgi:biotin carboxyl carrier protein
VAKHQFVIEGEEYEVEVGTRMGNNVDVVVNGKTGAVEVTGGTAPTTVAPPNPSVAAPLAAPARPAASSGGAVGEVRAPIPGVVLKVSVEPGQSVTAATELLVLEAMKMENEIPAGIAGVVEKVLVKPQQEVAQGDLLVTIKAS